MKIDVAINSCGRIDLLEKDITSFKENIVTKHKLRFILLEDLIEDVNRMRERDVWLGENYKLFDKIIFSEKKLGVMYGLTELLENHIKSDIFIRNEDDNCYVRRIDIDPLIKLFQDHDDIAKIQWKRSGHAPKSFKGEECEIDGIPLINIKIYGNCAGIFSRKWALKMIDKTDGRWSPPKKVAWPAMKALGGKNYFYGRIRDLPTCIHMGKLMDYVKGSYG